MTHLKASNDNHTIPSIICVERETQTSIILGGSPEDFEQLLEMARSMKVPFTLIITDDEQAGLLMQQGWKLTGLKVLQHE